MNTFISLDWRFSMPSQKLSVQCLKKIKPLIQCLKTIAPESNCALREDHCSICPDRSSDGDLSKHFLSECSLKESEIERIAERYSV